MAASPGSGVRSCSSHQSARKRRQRRAHDVRWRDHLPWRARGCYNHVHSYCFALKLTGHSQSDAACRWPGAQVILLGRGSQISNQRNFGILSTFKYFQAGCSLSCGDSQRPHVTAWSRCVHVDEVDKVSKVGEVGQVGAPSPLHICKLP